MSLGELNRIGDILRQALAMPTVNDLGRLTGQAQRLRTVTPHRLFVAIVSALSARRVETLADLLRVFNHQQGVRVAYKAFYNRLARPGFEAFMRAMCGCLMRDCRLQTLEPDGERAVAQFRDIVIQDGSSFALKRALKAVFPGQFTTKGPAAVELHATYNPHIAAGLISAGLCAALLKRFLAHAAQRVGHGTAISTRRVALCAHLLLTDLVAALLRGRGLLKARQEAMEYLLANAGRANVPHEHRIGRLRSGLVLVSAA